MINDFMHIYIIYGLSFMAHHLMLTQFDDFMHILGQDQSRSSNRIVIHCDLGMSMHILHNDLHHIFSICLG